MANRRTEATLAGGKQANAWLARRFLLATMGGSVNHFQLAIMQTVISELVTSAARYAPEIPIGVAVQRGWRHTAISVSCHREAPDDGPDPTTWTDEMLAWQVVDGLSDKVKIVRYGDDVTITAYFKHRASGSLLDNSRTLRPIGARW